MHFLGMLRGSCRKVRTYRKQTALVCLFWEVRGAQLHFGILLAARAMNPFQQQPTFQPDTAAGQMVWIKKWAGSPSVNGLPALKTL